MCSLAIGSRATDYVFTKLITEQPDNEVSPYTTEEDKYNFKIQIMHRTVTDHILFIYCFFTIYSRYLKGVISKRDGCEYLKQVPSIDGSLELI
jgi:hypothetical protein